MKKKIVILGSTGSIGKTALSIISKEKKKFDIKLLSTNVNVEEIIEQAKKFNVKNIIIADHSRYLFAKNKYKKLKINFYNSFSIIDKIFKPKEIFYSLIAIVGLSGLLPTISIIKFTNNIAIANKESIICGWNLIKKDLIKYNTNFIPIDSEHFSIYILLKNLNVEDVEKIYITASGGPFLKKKTINKKKIKLNQALNHPTYKMGKKISIDSSTLMNKVFEIIEARKLFDINYNQIEILTHPKSYIHSIISFKNGVSKILIHEPDMKIPIFNSIYNNSKIKIHFNPINLKILNNLELNKVNRNQFPLTKILNKFNKKNLSNSLYETIIVTVNDFFVQQYINNKIDYQQLINLINKMLNKPYFLKYRKIEPANIQQIHDLNKYVSSKLTILSI